MLPKWGKKAKPSLAPKFDDLISYLDGIQTFNSSAKCTISPYNDGDDVKAQQFPLMPISDSLKAARASFKSQSASSSQSSISTVNDDNDNFGGPTDQTIYKISTSTSMYVTDLKGNESDTMKMVMNECKNVGLTSARFYRAPPQYYQEKIEWRRDILKAPHIKYLCKSLLMKNIRCTKKDCEDPTNSLFYLVIFQYVTRINSEKIMKFVRKIHGFKVGKKKFKFRLASSEENDIQTGFKHNAVTAIGIKNKKIPIILSKRLLDLDHFWMGGGEYDVKLAVDVNEFRNVYKPYVADIVYDGLIDPNENLAEEREDH